MKKYRLLVLLSLLLSMSIRAQDTIRLIPPRNSTVKWMILRRLVGARALFKGSVDHVSRGGALFIMDKDAPAGEYAVQYDTRHTKGLRFIYNHEPVVIRFKPHYAAFAEVLKSKENKAYFAFQKADITAMVKFKKLKKQFYKTKNPALQKTYRRMRARYYKTMDSLLRVSKNLMAYHFIQGKIESLPPKLMPNVPAYVRYAEAHYFDRNDLNDKVLYNSGIVHDRVNEYVLRIPMFDFGFAKSRHYIRRIDTVMKKLTYNPSRSEVLYSLIDHFSTEDRKVLNHLLAYYNRLSGRYRDTVFLHRLAKQHYPIKGDKFPLEKLKKTGKFKLQSKPYYLFVFFSSDCPHCRRALPKLYEKTKNLKNVQVISIGLENTEQHWKDFIKNFGGWTNLRVVADKEPDAYQDIVQSYNIEYTPTYFLTDSHLRILEKDTGESIVKRIVRYLQKHER